MGGRFICGVVANEIARGKRKGGYGEKDDVLNVSE